MKTKLKFLSAAAILAMLSTPAVAADVTLYLRGVFKAGSDVTRYRSGPNGEDPVTSSTSLAGTAFRAVAEFDKVYDVTTDTSRWVLANLTGNLPFQVPNLSPRNEYGSDALDFHAMWNPANGHGGSIDYGVFAFGLAGTGLTRDGDLSTIDLTAFDPQRSSVYYSYQAGQDAGFDRPVDTVHARADMTVDAISLTPFAAGVPEPAAWTLMIGGFGMAAGAIRRRQATRVSVAYA